MNRSHYFNYIEDKLNTLAYRVETRGRLNLLDTHLHSENFHLHFFNLLFGHQLENLNSRLQNVEAIDLIDNQIIFSINRHLRCCLDIERHSNQKRFRTKTDL